MAETVAGTKREVTTDQLYRYAKGWFIENDPINDCRLLIGEIEGHSPSTIDDTHVLSYLAREAVISLYAEAATQEDFVNEWTYLLFSVRQLLNSTESDRMLVAARLDDGQVGLLLPSWDHACAMAYLVAMMRRENFPTELDEAYSGTLQLKNSPDGGVSSIRCKRHRKVFCKECRGR